MTRSRHWGPDPTSEVCVPYINALALLLYRILRNIPSAKLHKLFGILASVPPLINERAAFRPAEIWFHLLMIIVIGSDGSIFASFSIDRPIGLDVDIFDPKKTAAH